MVTYCLPLGSRSRAIIAHAWRTLSAGKVKMPNDLPSSQALKSPAVPPPTVTQDAVVWKPLSRCRPSKTCDQRLQMGVPLPSVNWSTLHDSSCSHSRSRSPQRASEGTMLPSSCAALSNVNEPGLPWPVYQARSTLST